MCRGHTEYEDLLQCNNLASSATPRGHQFPAAFMTMASGLDAVSWTDTNGHQPISFRTNHGLVVLKYCPPRPARSFFVRF